jgi:hypothetical protein
MNEELTANELVSLWVGDGVRDGVRVGALELTLDEKPGIEVVAPLKV